MTVWNRSQFDLLQLYVHTGGYNTYFDSENLLTAPLPPEAKKVVTITAGQYVTVVRKKIEVGDTMALTTAEPLDVWHAGFTLIVFDESFRLLSPGQDGG